MATALVKENNPITNSLLLISTQGRYSGDREINFLTFRMDKDRYVVAATAHDGLFKPGWYLNLKEEPVVEVEVQGERFHAKAETPVGVERLRLWSLVEEISPLSRDQALRDTTVVVLTPMCEVLVKHDRVA